MVELVERLYIVSANVTSSIHTTEQAPLRSVRSAPLITAIDTEITLCIRNMPTDLHHEAIGLLDRGDYGGFFRCMLRAYEGEPAQPKLTLPSTGNRKITLD